MFAAFSSLPLDIPWAAFVAALLKRGRLSNPRLTWLNHPGNPAAPFFNSKQDRVKAWLTAWHNLKKFSL
jgi:hypothetical protein